MRARTTALFGASVLAAGAIAPAGAWRAGAEDRAPPPFQVEVNVTGRVASTDDAGFTIDDARFVWPSSEARSPWSADDCPESGRPPVAAGDFVHVFGALRPDGAVIACADDPASEFGASGSRWVSGVVEAMGGDSITVAGTSYQIATAPYPGINTMFQFAGGGCGARAPGEDVKVGDAVLCSTTPDGILRWVTVRSNSYGDPATITGLVTRDFATYVANDGGDCRSFAGVAGAMFDVDDVFCFALADRADRADPYSLVTGPLAEGDTVKVNGRARDGVFLVDSVEVLAWEDAAKSLSRGTVRRSVRLAGVVTAVDPGEFVVDGVHVDLAAKMERSLRRRPLRVGDRVVVRGRAAADGRVTAVTLRRR